MKSRKIIFLVFIVVLTSGFNLDSDRIIDFVPEVSSLKVKSVDSSSEDDDPFLKESDSISDRFLEGKIHSDLYTSCMNTEPTVEDLQKNKIFCKCWLSGLSELLSLKALSLINDFYLDRVNSEVYSYRFEPLANFEMAVIDRCRKESSENPHDQF